MRIIGRNFENIRKNNRYFFGSNLPKPIVLTLFEALVPQDMNFNFTR